MTVKQLIEKLKEYPEDMSITINECMDFSESIGETIVIKENVYMCFPYSDNDRFNYLSLEIRDKEYWEEKIFDFNSNLCYNIL